MKFKYIFKRYNDNETKMLWSDSLINAIDQAGAGWNLFMIKK